MNNLIDKTAKKQARGKPFPKGVSGNPFGRPKGQKNWDTIFELALEKIVKEKKLPIKDPEAEMVIKAVIESLKGNYNYFKDLMDRKYGKPKESIDLGAGEKPVVVKIILDKKETEEVAKRIEEKNEVQNTGSPNAK